MMLTPGRCHSRNTEFGQKRRLGLSAVPVADVDVDVTRCDAISTDHTIGENAQARFNAARVKLYYSTVLVGLTNVSTPPVS